MYHIQLVSRISEPSTVAPCYQVFLDRYFQLRCSLPFAPPFEGGAQSAPFKTLGEKSREGGWKAPGKFAGTDHSYWKMIPWKWVFSLGFPPIGTTLYKYPIFSHFFRRWVTHPIFSSREQKTLDLFNLLSILIWYKAWSCTPPHLSSTMVFLKLHNN